MCTINLFNSMCMTGTRATRKPATPFSSSLPSPGLSPGWVLVLDPQHQFCSFFWRTARLVLWASLRGWPDCYNQLVTRCGVYPTWILYSTLIDAENFVEMFPAYYIFNGLLGTLQLLHILWTYFLFKAIQKALSKGGVDDKRSDSEPSEEEEDENENQLKKDI